MDGRPWRRVERIGSCVDGALHPRVRSGLAGFRAVEAWPRLAGDAAAAKSMAVACRDGRLIVEVVNSAWLYQLSSSKHAFLAALERDLGAGVVHDIVFRINPEIASIDH